VGVILQRGSGICRQRHVVEPPGPHATSTDHNFGVLGVVERDVVVCMWKHDRVAARHSARRARARILFAAAAVVVLHLSLTAGSGYWLPTRSPIDELAPANAVLVLAGQHHGREEFGIELAKLVGAGTVLLSDAYQAEDPVMRTLCSSSHSTVKVVCFRPKPATTRGEAQYARQLAMRYGWSRIVVVTWRYHLPRAPLVFAQCYSADPGSVIMRAAPREYSVTVTDPSTSMSISALRY
jgi:uncharacterized SAM-binding protein YcdF (DUF218 family)